jgi:hypothetical protein
MKRYLTDTILDDLKKKVTVHGFNGSGVQGCNFIPGFYLLGVFA